MNYQEWNELIAGHFFNEQMANKEITLYVNEEMIDKLGGDFGCDLADFILAVKGSSEEDSGEEICGNALTVYHNWRETGATFPPYIAYLSLFVLAGATEYAGIDPKAYYPKLRILLNSPARNGPPRHFYDMEVLWRDLEKWSTEDKKEEWGKFTLHVRGGWRHIGIPLFQTLFSTDELDRLPVFFSYCELDPMDPPTPEAIINHLKESGFQVFRSRTMKMLYEDTEGGRAFQMALARLILEHLENWDGMLVEGTPELPSGKRITQPSLRICLYVDSVSGSIRAFARFKSPREIPEDGLVLAQKGTGKQYSCTGGPNGWSSYLVASDGKLDERLDASTLDWSRGERFNDEAGSWNAYLRPAEARAFRKGVENLRDWVEVQKVERGTEYLIAAKSPILEKVADWGKSSCTTFDRMGSKGLPAGWELLRCKDIMQSCRDVRLLAISSDVGIELVGGIKTGTSRNSYFDFARPTIYIQNGTGEESISINGIIQPAGQQGERKIPRMFGPDSPIVIELSANDERIDRKVIRIDNFGLPGNFSTTPFRSSCGNLVSATESAPTAQGGMVFNVSLPDPPMGQLPFYLSERILFIGSIVGQVADWPSEQAPTGWTPAWAIASTGKGRWKAYYCGTTIEHPNVGHEETPNYNRKAAKRWREALYINRKVTERPNLRITRKLWEEYTEVARNAQ